MNEMFQSSVFWLPYLTLEGGDLSESTLDRLLDHFPEYAPRRIDREEESHGTTYRWTQRAVLFPIRASERFSLEVKFDMSRHGCSKTLNLVEGSERQRMGWWDMARWHPYCLRLSELDRLVECSVQSGQYEGRGEIPFLLLCQFVGIEWAGQLEAMNLRLQNALEQIVVSPFPWEQPLLRQREDYTWNHDDQLGWLFSSEVYGCYSTRNRDHSDTEEAFPFSKFNALLNAMD